MVVNAPEVADVEAPPPLSPTAVLSTAPESPLIWIMDTARFAVDTLVVAVKVFVPLPVALVLIHIEEQIAAEESEW